MYTRAPDWCWYWFCFVAWPCNATLSSNYAPHVFASLKYPYMAMLDLDCHVTIRAPKDSTILLSFPTVYFKQSVCNEWGSGITVHDGSTEAAPVKAKVCSSSQGVPSFRSTSDSLFIRFRSTHTAMAFQGVYEFSTCTSILILFIGCFIISKLKKIITHIH